MLADHVYIAFFSILGVLFVGMAFMVSFIFRPKPPKDDVKNAPYECGEVVKGTSWVQFNVRYYLFALIFVIFDVEVLFVAPWAVVFKELGKVAYLEMVVFIFILFVGLVYAWKKGALEWQ